MFFYVFSTGRYYGEEEIVSLDGVGCGTRITESVNICIRVCRVWTYVDIEVEV